MAKIKHRPVFSSELMVAEFARHYWYKEELIAICKREGIDSRGSKADLESRLINFLRTGRKKRGDLSKHRKRGGRIRLNSKIIDGFSFNAHSRDFFGKLLGISDFKFTMEMAQFVREAKSKENQKATVADLLRIYEKVQMQKASGTRKLPHTLRWNRFVRDFNADSKTRHLTDRMNSAAKLWAIVRDTPGPKKYSSALLRYLR